MFGYSKEPSHGDGFFEYPQHMFWLRNKKNNFQSRTLIWGPAVIHRGEIPSFFVFVFRGGSFLYPIYSYTYRVRAVKAQRRLCSQVSSYGDLCNKYHFLMDIPTGSYCSRAFFLNVLDFFLHSS